MTRNTSYKHLEGINGLGGGVVFPINMKFPIRITRGSAPCFQFDA